MTVNGEARDTQARTLAALWAAETEHLAPNSRRGFAIALNGEVVRAARWDETVVGEGDRVEIIRAVAGG
jgi:sulfur carrier protein